MRYDIEPVGLEDIGEDIIEEVLESMPSPDRFYLTAELPIPLEAKVLRNLEPGRDIVRLSSDGESVDLLRDGDKPGDIGVSCDPDGDEVPVDTLNIEFRDYNDDFTDRGIVWVSPGNPANMHFCIKAQALETPGMVTEIVTAAEKAVENKVLSHF